MEGYGQVFGGQLIIFVRSLYKCTKKERKRLFLIPEKNYQISCELIPVFIIRQEHFKETVENRQPQFFDELWGAVVAAIRGSGIEAVFSRWEKVCWSLNPASIAGTQKLF